MDECLLRAWHDLFGETEKTAREVLKATAGRAIENPKALALREAIAGVLGKQTGVIKLGRYFAARLDTGAGGYRLTGTYDSSKRHWIYSVFRVQEPSDAEIERKIADAVAAREKRLPKSLIGKLRAVEKDHARLEQLEKPQVENARARGWRLKREERENAQAQEAIERAEAERLERQSVYLAPRIGHFAVEKLAETRCKNLRAAGFDATLLYLSATRTIIRVSGPFDRDELAKAAAKYLLSVHEQSQAPVAQEKPLAPGMIWDDDRREWIAQQGAVDYSSARFTRLLMAGNPDKPDGKPTGFAAWSPFDVGTPRKKYY